MCHNLPRIGYKMPYNKVYTKETSMTSIQELTTTKGMTDIQEFVDYVDSFYGQNDPLYPLVYQGQPLTKTDILQATIVYLEQCDNDDFEQCAWGDGDSLDRERVRDILLDKFNYDHKGGTW